MYKRDFQEWLRRDAEERERLLEIRLSLPPKTDGELLLEERERHAQREEAIKQAVRRECVITIWVVIAVAAYFVFGLFLAAIRGR
jgi:hypothetical protein